MRAERRGPARARGFTLIELVVAIVVFGLMASTLVALLRPAIDSHAATRARADLAAQGDLALRRLQADLRSAVPHSIRTPAASCFELVPTHGGGRYRRAPDTVNDSGPGCTPGAACSAALDTTRPSTVFDVLSRLPTTPAVGDFVVVDNRDPDGVYGGTNRATVTEVTTPPTVFGPHRIGITPTQFPRRDDGGSFVVVPAAQRAVFYVCSGADGTLDERGDGKGTLYRLMNYGFESRPPQACPDTAGAAVLATRVLSCRFEHAPPAGAARPQGLVRLQIELARAGETLRLHAATPLAGAP